MAVGAVMLLVIEGSEAMSEVSVTSNDLGKTLHFFINAKSNNQWGKCRHVLIAAVYKTRTCLQPDIKENDFRQLMIAEVNCGRKVGLQAKIFIKTCTSIVFSAYHRTKLIIELLLQKLILFSPFASILIDINMEFCEFKTLACFYNGNK